MTYIQQSSQLHDSKTLFNWHFPIFISHLNLVTYNEVINFVTQKCKLVEKILGCYHLNETSDWTFVKYYYYYYYLRILHSFFGYYEQLKGLIPMLHPYNYDSE